MREKVQISLMESKGDYKLIKEKAIKQITYDT